MTTTTRPADCPTCMHLYPWTCAEHKGAGAPTVDDGSDEVLEEIERMMIARFGKEQAKDLTFCVAMVLCAEDDDTSTSDWLAIAKRRS